MRFNKTYHKLLELLKLEKSEISAIYFYAILDGLIQLSLPLGIQAIIGFALGAQMVTSVYVLIILVVTAVLFVGILQINQMKIIEKIQQKIFVRYSFQFAEKIPKLDLKEIDKVYLPEKINTFFDTLNIQKGISKLLLDIPIATIQIIFGLILLSLYHPLFIVFSVILILVVWFIFALTGKRGLETSVAESEHKYAVIGWLEEMARAIKSFKYSQGTHLNLQKTDEHCVKYVSSRTAHFKILMFQFKALIAFKVSITALMLIIGTILLFDQRLNIGEFVAAEIVILTIIGSLEKLIKALESVYDVVTGLFKVETILGKSSEKDGQLSFSADKADVNIDKMSFSYDDNTILLQDVNAFIPGNSLTVISGAEGSGKSTILKLLTGCYSDFEGSIEINDIPIQSYSLGSLRKATGVFLYEQDLFQGTLYENITLGFTEISQEDILKLGAELGFGNFIAAFPEVFDTQIDPSGKNLPNSLVRKILLLRALVNKPKILILEEPWIGLGEKTAQSIKDYIVKTSKNNLVVVSTNDSSFFQYADHHLHIENRTLLKIN